MEIQILEEQPLGLINMKGKILEIEKRDSELNLRLKKVKGYIDIFATTPKEEVEEIKKKLENLNIPRVKDKHIAKMIDIMPEDLDGLKAIISGENITIKQEDLQKMLDVLKAK
ncbi:hypothetical protein J4430_01855 [Candidatus Woesearchaeota archaeon]|nr:hypothetical protein [Candidatus Woesearchaeota archaeon]